MPYGSTNELPAYIKKYSEVVQRQWLHVFNTVYGSTNGSEARAFKAANAVLKKRFKGKESMDKNTRDDYFNHLVDNWLGNLTG
jgi:hypothetical protein